MLRVVENITSMDSYVIATGSEDHTMQGFWAILSLNVFGLMGSIHGGPSAQIVGF